MIVAILLCFSSCNQKENSDEILQNIMIDCISLIGKEVPDTYETVFIHTNFSYEDGTYDIESRYFKKLNINQENPAEIFIYLKEDSGVIETCNISISFSDYLDTRQYYELILSFFKDYQWEFIKNIHRLKYPNGELYYSKGIYAGVYDPSSIPRSISMSFSKHKALDGFYD
jgi:hypothetical protein